MQLLRPDPEYLASGFEAGREELSRIHADAAAFLTSMEDRDSKGSPVTLPDGSTARRLPGFRRSLWDGEFCGSIGLRWQPATPTLPPHCLGHIGYAVVPWKQHLGYAKSALSLILPEAKTIGFPYVEITSAVRPSNSASFSRSGLVAWPEH